MNEGYKEGGGEARSKEEREGSKPCCDLFLVLSESTESLSLSLFFQQREEEKNEDKMRSPRFFFGLLALTALASVASCSSSAPPTSDVVPSVDPELNWLTPQEFKVEKAGQEKRSIALSPSSSEFRIAKRAGLVLRPARTIPRSWAPSKRKRSWLRRQGQSYRAQRREEKGEKAAEAFCFLAVALAAIDLFFFFLLHPTLSPSPPPHQLQPQELDLKKNAKPIMYLFSRPGCSACDSLKATLGPEASPALKALTKMFVVVHVQGPETLGDDKALRRKYAAPEFEPHGNYVPRAMFADARTGKVRAEIARPVSGDSGAEFPHFVSTSGELESAMRHALVRLLGKGKGLKVGSAPGEPLKKVERRMKRQARKKQAAAAGSSGSAASRAEM